MKKLIWLVAVVVVFSSLFRACGKSQEVKSEGDISGEKLSIVTTIFPEYDWVRQITKGNENVEITMLLDNGVDLHSYQPTADDLVKISSCDVFIYVGGESDEWVEDALAEATNKEMKVINLLDSLGDSVKEEELVEGMEGEEEEEGEEKEEEGTEYDEHVWLSLSNASTLCKLIANTMAEVDSADKELYEKNAEAYCKELDELNKEYSDMVENASTKTVLFGDRFPFRYLVDDYGLDYYAAFVGCSAESEASFETITFLASKVDELELSSILQIESADGKIAETIKENTADKNQQILTLNSMQSVTGQDVENGTAYIDLMKENLEVLKQALN